MARRSGLSRRQALGGAALLVPLAACSRTDDPAPPANVALAPLGSPNGLVELVRLEPGLKLDIRYATADNFTGRILYPQARAFLRAEAAEALIVAHRAAAQDGFGLTIFDGYRPFRITKLMWDVTPRKNRNYVANPKQGSRHNRGCAVDLTLHDLKTGLPVEMPSAYDEFSQRAHLDFLDAPEIALRNRAYLVALMQAHGFFAMSNEWWHYDYKDWKQFPLLDVPFEGV